MITSQQKAHWETFGFFILRQLFTPDEVNVMRKAAIEIINQEGGGNAFNSDPGFGSGAFLERHPVLANWIDDDRIYSIMETLLGPDFILEHTGGAVIRGDTPWHGGPPPGTHKPMTHGKVAMYFDSLRKESGCLRVIPGSHRRPFGSDLAPIYHEADQPQPMVFGVADEDIPSVALESDPGDVIVFTEPVFHGAFGSKIGRLQITAEFNSNPTSDEQVRDLLEFHDKATWSFHPSETYINSDRPRIRRMVTRLLELGCTPFPV